MLRHFKSVIIFYSVELNTKLCDNMHEVDYLVILKQMKKSVSWNWMILIVIL